ncbi:NAD-dependent epimerase/dehydratase family protein [Halobacterium salinarum]|uniref:NAD-dependent epimerase/dehydratase family protein n=1 Tax=Halobacterium salinarum TaxID=2242 RepID=UPI0025577C6B|nr:NAD-dependent epimerase/dehydratase family protein [Halobacterium salinarum]MDL0131624.1 NAD-dependent epimerase/dehydratase family protein [Halobacterium salinarum]
MPALTNQNILITGGAGFVGSHLADTLTPQNNVTIVDNLSASTPEHIPDTATFHEADIRNPGVLDELTESVDIVFHEAAIVSVNQSIEAPVHSHETNTDATLELLELARQRDFRVVLASSAAIYGHPEVTPILEHARKTPTSPYGLDKLTIDHYARLYHDLYDVDTVALRYFNIYGPRQTAGDYAGVIAIFRDQAQSGDPITIEGDGNQTRDFVHISDVVDANIRAATTDHVGEAYNIGTGTKTSITELAETIRDVADSDSEIVHTEPRDGDIDESVADITKAQTELGYEPTHSLRDGLQTLLDESDSD